MEITRICEGVSPFTTGSGVVCVSVNTSLSKDELMSEAGREVSGQKHTGFVRILDVDYLITGTRLYRYMIRAGDSRRLF